MKKQYNKMQDMEVIRHMEDDEGAFSKFGKASAFVI